MLYRFLKKSVTCHPSVCWLIKSENIRFLMQIHKDPICHVCALCGKVIWLICITETWLFLIFQVNALLYIAHAAS